MNAIMVFLGGGLGSLLRFGIAYFIKPLRVDLPLATLLANILSCILLGILVGLASKGMLNLQQRSFFVVGFCGGFSTFSTFSYESLQLIQEERWVEAISYVFFSWIIGLICIILGLQISQ